MAFWLAVGATRAEAYGVRLRWLHDTQGDVAGYRVHVWPDEGPAEPERDVGLPPEAEDGTLAAIVAGLAPRVDYSIAVSAVFSDGTETALSNVLRIAYADVAPLIDSDGDGVKDAADDCPDTAPGATVGPSGCTYDQLACDDAFSPGDLTDQRVVLRPTRGGRSWKLQAVATMLVSGAGRLLPRDAVFEIWGAGAAMSFRAAVRSDRFAPRARLLRFVAKAEGAVGGLHRLEIAERNGRRTVRVNATVPAVSLPDGAAAPLTWLVRFGDECARALHVVCTPLRRRFVCR